jgi:uncharacterized protein (TIGR02265 family)
MKEPVFFGSAFEALYLNAIANQLTPQLRDELRRLGLDLAKPLQAAYPFEVWYRCLLTTATTLAPGESREAAVERIGAAFLEGYQRTLIGAAIAQLGRVIGIERSLVRINRTNRTSNNVFVSGVEHVGPRHLKLFSQLDPDFNGRFPPGEVALVHFQTGVVRAAFKALTTDVPTLHTRLLDANTRHGEIEVQW